MQNAPLIRINRSLRSAHRARLGLGPQASDLGSLFSVHGPGLWVNAPRTLTSLEERKRFLFELRSCVFVHLSIWVSFKSPTDWPKNGCGHRKGKNIQLTCRWMKRAEGYLSNDHNSINNRTFIKLPKLSARTFLYGMYL